MIGLNLTITLNIVQILGYSLIQYFISINLFVKFKKSHIIGIMIKKYLVQCFKISRNNLI